MSFRNLAIACTLISAVVAVQIDAIQSASSAPKRVTKFRAGPRGPVAGAINLNAQGSSFIDPLLTGAAQHIAGGSCTTNFPTGTNANRPGWFNTYGLNLKSGSALAGGFAGNISPLSIAPEAPTVAANVAMSYGSVGSGTGKSAFYAAAPNTTTNTCERVDSPYAFSATDNPYSLVPADPITVAAAGGARLIQVPAAIGAVGQLVNSGVKLNAGRVNSLGETVPLAKAISRQEVCGIWKQTITDWHDIDSTNPVGSIIKLKVRSGSSGTTLILARHLQANCGNGPWTVAGVPSNNAASWTFPIPGFVDATSVVNSDVADKVKTGAFAFGYADAAFGKINGNVILALQNKSLAYKTASSAAISAAFAGTRDVDTTLPGHESRIELGITGNPTATWDPTNAAAYPIVGATYFTFYGRNAARTSWYDTNPAFDAGTKAAVKSFINWYTTKSNILTSDADRVLANITGYGALPGGVAAGVACPVSPALTDAKCQIRRVINNTTFGI